jgi:hypothetical protein
VTDKARAQRNRSETSPSLQMGVRPTRKAVQRAATSISAQRQAEMVMDNGGESYQSNQESFEEVPSNQTVSAQGEKRKSIKPKISLSTNSETRDSNRPKQTHTREQKQKQCNCVRMKSLWEAFIRIILGISVRSMISLSLGER